MTAPKGLITAGIVALQTTFGSEAKAQECDTSWANPSAFAAIPPSEWNLELLASMGSENIAIVSEGLDVTAGTLKQEIKNIFDGLDQAAAREGVIDAPWYTENGYNSLFAPLLEEIQEKVDEPGADVSSILAEGRNSAIQLVDDVIYQTRTALHDLDTSKTVCLARPAAPALE